MALLLIPEAVNKILERGRREGWEEGFREGREEGRKQVLEEVRKAERERIRQLLQGSSLPLTPEQAKTLFKES